MKAPQGGVAVTCGLPQPYLLFLGDTAEPGFAKTAFGLRDWAPELCVGEFALPEAHGQPRTAETAPRRRCGSRRPRARNRRCQFGRLHREIPGFLPSSRRSRRASTSSAECTRGSPAFPSFAYCAERLGRRLIDVRKPPANIPIATGSKRSGKRLLTVGTDCALGKKYSALSIARAFSARGVDADFRATGQTGIMIAGGGIPMDAVVSDFAAGAAEMLSPDAAPDHWDVIEGQGSILHPAYAGVSLALLHGSQPDVFVVCHDPSAERLLGHEEFALSHRSTRSSS